MVLQPADGYLGAFGVARTSAAYSRLTAFSLQSLRSPFSCSHPPATDSLSTRLCRYPWCDHVPSWVGIGVKEPQFGPSKRSRSGKGGVAPIEAWHNAGLARGQCGLVRRTPRTADWATPAQAKLGTTSKPIPVVDSRSNQLNASKDHFWPLTLHYSLLRMRK